jgi:hypothetical protein
VKTKKYKTASMPEERADLLACHFEKLGSNFEVGFHTLNSIIMKLGQRAAVYAHRNYHGKIQSSLLPVLRPPEIAQLPSQH